jgi:RNA binding exosome subunit
MTKLIFMKEVLDTFSKEKIEMLLPISEIKQDEKGVHYLSVDVEKYLQQFKDE